VRVRNRLGFHVGGLLGGWLISRVARGDGASKGTLDLSGPPVAWALVCGARSGSVLELQCAIKYLIAQGTLLVCIEVVPSIFSVCCFMRWISPPNCEFHRERLTAARSPCITLHV